MSRLDRSQILSYRYRANGLHDRLAAGKLAPAARAGLQDSAPHSGVMSLHARVAGVTADDWTDGHLVQVWGPRGAVFLVPKADLAVFTLGMLPRDRARVAELEKRARMVLRMLDGRPQSRRAILEGVPAIGELRELLRTAATGWFLPIWDAAATAVYPAEPAAADPEESRLELGRRFLHYLGPSTTKALQWWTGASIEDAAATIKALGPELATIDVDGDEVLMLAEDVETAQSAEQPEGLHLLPPEDPYVNRLCGPLLVPDGHLYRRLYPPGILPGALVVDGEVVALWHRRARRFTLTPFPGKDVGELMSPVAAAAADLPLPGDPELTSVDWDID